MLDPTYSLKSLGLGRRSKRVAQQRECFVSLRAYDRSIEASMMTAWHHSQSCCFTRCAAERAKDAKVLPSFLWLAPDVLVSEDVLRCC